MTIVSPIEGKAVQLNAHEGERLELHTSWTIPYQRFDGVLRHVDGTEHEIAQMALNGFYETFSAVFAYAQEHGFTDAWEVQALPETPRFAAATAEVEML